MKLGFLFFILVQLSTSWSPLPTDAIASTTWSYPPSVTGIQGQNITITFAANLSDHNPGTTWKLVTIRKNGARVISITPGRQKTIPSPFEGRSSDLELNVTQNGAIVTIKFTFSNLVKDTDEGDYTVNPFGTSDFEGSVPATPTSLSINIPTVIISPNPATVTVNETQTAHLVCNATGDPTPSINWTRDGVIVSTGSPFTTPAVTFNDDKTCYTCVAYNGVLGARTASVCLNVQYKPRNDTLQANGKAGLSRDKTVVCQNDKVNLTCTSGPANPAANSYEFYNNGVLVVTSASNVYEATATAGLPDVNKFVCVPRNILGGSLENASVEVAAKVPPVIVTSPSSEPLLEGSNLTLFCNASGVPAPNITWTKVGGGIAVVTNTETYTIASVTRGVEGTYRCTASNGDECSNATAEASVVVNYKPENTNLAASNATACVSKSLTLTCNTQAKPNPTTYRFYENDVLLKAQAANTYIFSLSVSGNNVYKCQPENSAGNGATSTVNVTVKAAPVIYYATPSQDVEEGKSLTLDCNVTDSSGHLNVSWHKVGGGQVSSTSTHTISSAARGDAGSYVCKAHNGNECDVQTKQIQITVTYPAAITSHSTLIVNANENEQITLTCRVSGVPPPYVTWYRDGQRINNARGGTYSFNALESLSGNYTCVVSNGIGATQRKTFNVKIKGYCKNHECKNGGTCRSEGQDYRCLCTRGLTGRYCDIKDPVHTEFECVLVIVKPYWKDGYGQKGSDDFKNLQKKICNKMFKVFNGKPPAIPGKRLVTCVLLKARRGSVYANTILTFNGTALRSEVFNAIPGGTVNKTIFGDLTLKDSGALQVYPRSIDTSPNPSICNPGVPITIFVAVIAVAVVIIVLLILVIIWMRFKGIQTNKRINSKDESKIEIPLQNSQTNAPSFGGDSTSIYENEGFISSQTERDGLEDMSLYEHVQNRGLVIHKGVGGATSFPMQTLPGRPGRPGRDGGATTSGNQAQSQFEEPSYLSLDLGEKEGSRRVNGNQGSYGYLVDFTRVPDNSTGASPQDQNPYQELQPENRSKLYQSLQSMQRPAFNV